MAAVNPAGPLPMMRHLIFSMVLRQFVFFYGKDNTSALQTQKRDALLLGSESSFLGITIVEGEKRSVWKV